MLCEKHRRKAIHRFPAADAAEQEELIEAKAAYEEAYLKAQKAGKAAREAKEYPTRILIIFISIIMKSKNCLYYQLVEDKRKHLHHQLWGSM